MHLALKILAAKAEDAPALAQLVNNAFVSERLFIEGERTSTNGVRTLLDTGVFLVAVHGSELAGTVYTEVRGDRGYFGLLAVDPRFQQRGWGRRLVAAAEEHCRSKGCRYMDLTYINLRPELHGYYRRLGYVENGTVELEAEQVAKVALHLVRMSKPL